ncbi:MAG: ureidoglycolate lyase [Pseudomonadota bacterium]
MTPNPPPEAVRAEPLTAEAFAPFGAVIAPDPARAVAINDGWTDRHHALAAADLAGGGAILSIFRGRPRPLTAVLLERHPHGSQAFVPLGGRPWLTVVAEARDGPLRAFLCAGDQGVQIGRGVWHHPLLTLAAQDFLVVDREDPAANLEEAALDPPVPIRL